MSDVKFKRYFNLFHRNVYDSTTTENCIGYLILPITD